MALIADAIDPYTVATVDRMSTPIAGRFPVPPVSWANLIDDVDPEMAFDKINPGVAGAVFPESRYLEPTIGQIWPR